MNPSVTEIRPAPRVAKELLKSNGFLLARMGIGFKTRVIALFEDEGFELAVFHSHLASPPRPSRTDVENIGLWQGRPYVILALHTGELGAWRIDDGRPEPLPLTLEA